MSHTHRHTAECKELLAQISDYIDGELEAKLCAELEQHLADCDNCRILIDTTQKTLVLFRRQHHHNKVALSEEGIAKLWQSLKDSGCISAENHL